MDTGITQCAASMGPRSGERGESTRNFTPIDATRFNGAALG